MASLLTITNFIHARSLSAIFQRIKLKNRYYINFNDYNQNKWPVEGQDHDFFMFFIVLIHVHVQVVHI